MNSVDATLTLKHCEDHLFRAKNFTARERALYYHLLRHTHFENKSTELFAILPLANSLDLAESSVRDDIRALHERGCIKIEERSRNGHLVRVLLPSEIAGVIPESMPERDLDIEALDFFADRRYLGPLLARDGNRCFYCLRAITPESCELDHVVSQMSGRNNSHKNIVCACHECNTTKQAQAASDFLRSLYRRGILSQLEMANRLEQLGHLQSGALSIDMRMMQIGL